MKKTSKHQGFTLVELLIVIVVIGVLSAMMMLSSTEAVSSAKASNIVSDLRNMKTAALAYYVDNLDTYKDSNKLKNINSVTPKDALAKYMGNGQLPDNANLVNNSNETEWYVYLPVTDARVADKLDARKTSVGLYAAATSNDKSTITTNTGAYMYVR